MEKIFLSPSPLSGSAHSSFSPAASFLTLPPSSLRGPVPGFRPKQRSPATDARAPFIASAADRAAPLSASLPGGAQWSEPSPTSSSSRTRAERNNCARFRASSPLSARLCPFIYPPRCPAIPYLHPAPAAASKLAKIATEIQAATISPPQRVSTSVSVLLGFVFIVQSRRDLPFALYYFVLIANPRRTLF